MPHAHAVESSANAGFTSPVTKPWLPFSSDLARRNVAAQAADSNSLFNVYRDLLQMRKTYPLFTNPYQELFPKTMFPADVLGFRRGDTAHEAWVLLNFGDRQAEITHPLGINTVLLKVGQVQVDSQHGRISLGKNSAIVCFVNAF